MRKFLIAILLFLSPILILGILGEVLLRNIPNDYILKREYLDKNASQIEVLILGNSSTYRAINPEYLSLNGYNLAYVSQTIDYDYKLFDKYKTSFNNLKYIILPISYSSLCINLSNSIEPWRAKNYRIYYHLDDYSDLSQYSEVLSNKQISNIKRIVDYYLKDKQPELSNDNGWGLRNENVTEQKLIDTGKKIASANTCDDYSVEQMNIEILRKLARQAEEMNFKLVLITTPSYKTFTDNIDKQQLERTSNIVKGIANSTKSCYYFDFLKDDQFTTVDYFDAAHLNEQGARKFTQKIDSLLNSL